MKHGLITILAILIFSGCTVNSDEVSLTSLTEEEPSQMEENLPKLEDLGPAPELNNETWLNTDAPLRLSDLRGKVVLLEMWTFG